MSSILDREEPSGHEEKKTRHNSNVVRREERMISPPSGEVSDDELTSMKGEGILLNQILELDSVWFGPCSCGSVSRVMSRAKLRAMETELKQLRE